MSGRRLYIEIALIAGVCTNKTTNRKLGHHSICHELVFIGISILVLLRLLFIYMTIIIYLY